MASPGFLQQRRADTDAALPPSRTISPRLTRSPTASPTNGDPTGGGGDTTRTISWQATDAQHTSPAVTSTLDTVHVAPTVAAGGTATFTGGGSPVTLDGALTVTDADSGDKLTGATVTIAPGF